MAAPLGWIMVMSVSEALRMGSHRLTRRPPSH